MSESERDISFLERWTTWMGNPVLKLKLALHFVECKQCREAFINILRHMQDMERKKSNVQT